MIKITFPDGSVREYNEGVTGLQIAESISSRLAQDVLACGVNGETIDLMRPINEDANFVLYKWDDEQGKHAFWHTSAHLLAEALQELYPCIQFGIGPAIENGFYYDVDPGDDVVIKESDLPAIEQKMIEYKRLADVKSESELELIKSEWKDRFSRISEPVENLIKLVQLRLLATKAGITLIRETDSTIRIYTNLSKGEWNIISAKTDRNITKYIKYTIAPNTCSDGNSILLINRNYLNFEELFNILSNLFYHILKIGYDYNQNNKG